LRYLSPTPLLAALIAFCAISTNLGCGTACPDIIKDFNQFEASLETPVASQAREPDARLRFPLKAANALIAELIRDRLNHPVALPPMSLPGGIRLPLPPLFWALSAVQMVVGGDDKLRAHVELELRDATGSIVAFAIDTRLQTVFEHKVKGLVTGARWTLAPDQIERVVPTLSVGGPDRIARWLGDQLPPALKFIGDRALIEALLPELLNVATNDGWPDIRDQVLGTEPLIDFAFAVPPEWGIARMKLNGTQATGTHSGAIELVMWPNLSKEAASASRGASPLDSRSEAPQLALSGPLAVHLVAKAQHRGELPGRFASDGTIDAEGPWHVRAVWQDGRRPFGAYLWRFDSSCRRVDLDANLDLALDGEELAVTVKDARVEGVKGPAFAEAFAWIERLFGAATDLTFRQATNLALEVGDATFHLKPSAVSHDSRGIAATLAYEVRRRGSPSSRSVQ